MNGESSRQNDIVWPGYVAAMASLLLSLLLVCAVLAMTIGQIGNISENYKQAIMHIGMGSAEDIKRMVKIAGVTDGALDGMSDAPELLTARFHSAKFGRKTDTTLALDLMTGQFDREAAKQAAAMAARDKQLLAEVDLSKVDVRKIKFKDLDFSSIQLHRGLTPLQIAKVDFSNVDFGKLTPQRSEKLKPILATEAIRYQLELLKVQPKPASAVPVAPKVTPPAPVTPTQPRPAEISTPTPTHYRMVFTDEATKLSWDQKQQLAAWVEVLKADNHMIKLWADIPTEDNYMQQSVYARLQQVRDWLVESGLPVSRIQLALQRQGSGPLRELVFHIARQSP